MRVHLVQDFPGHFSLHVLDGDPRLGEAHVLTEATFEEHEEGEFLPPASIQLDEQNASELMDALWRAGVRPSQVGTAGHVEALREHRDSLEKTLERVLPSALRSEEG